MQEKPREGAGQADNGWRTGIQTLKKRCGSKKKIASFDRFVVENKGKRKEI